jgi:uncharacterized protein
MINWLADQIDHHPRLITILVVLVTVLALMGLVRLEYESDLYRQVGASDRQISLMEKSEERFGTQVSDCYLLIRSDDLFSAEGVLGLRDLCQRLNGIEGVSRTFSLEQIPVFEGLAPGSLLPEKVSDPNLLQQAWETALEHPLIRGHLMSPDLKSALVIVRLDDAGLTTSEFAPIVDSIRQLALEIETDYGLAVSLSGIPVLRADIPAYMNFENTKFFVGMLVTGLVTGLLIFRRLSPLLIAAIPPLLGVLWALGWAGWVQVKWTMMSLAMPTMVFVVGFMDGIHLVLHMQGRMALAQVSAREAALSAVRAIGGACALTSLTTAIGFGSLILANSYSVRNLGISCAMGTLATFVSVICLMPLLAGTALGQHALGAHGKRRRISSMLGVPLEWILKMPKRICVLGIGLTLVLASFTLTLQVDTSENSDWILRSCPAVEAFQEYCDAFESGGMIHVFLDWSQSEQEMPTSLPQALDQVHHLLETEPMTSFPISVLSLLQSGPLPSDKRQDAMMSLLPLVPTQLLNQFLLPEEQCAQVSARFSGSTASENETCFDRVDSALEQLSETYPEIDFQLTGSSIAYSRVIIDVIRDLGTSLAMALVIITIVMIWTFRSLRLGLICLIPNMLPLATISMVLVLIGRNLSAPYAVLFTVCLGIAVDDTIHFVMRYRFQRNQGAGPTQAIRASYDTVGRAMVVTTFILVFGSCGMLSSSLLGYRIFTLLACSAFVAALVGDLLILPALLLCLDRKDSQ